MSKSTLIGSALLAFLAGCSGGGAPDRSDAMVAVAGSSPSGVGGSSAGAGTGVGGSVSGGGGETLGGAGGNGGSGGTGGGVASGAGGGITGGTGGTGGEGASPAGSAGTPPEPGSREEERAILDDELAELEGLNATTLQERYPTAFEAAPTYDAAAVTGLDTIQNSLLALTDAELAALTQKGFVISAARSFPTFAYGYSSIYSEDLPVYISADSILDGVHRSFDMLLKTIETSVLMGDLTELLDGMRARLQSGTGTELGAEVRADADVFLAVAASLLTGQTVAPVAGGDATAIQNFVDLATAATGTAGVSLFGADRPNEDFSQFKPRGHYTETPELGRYFRAMMWLGRIDFRLLETNSDGSRTFHRRQLEGTLLMDALIDDALQPLFDGIDATIGIFIGDPDYMELSEVGSLLADAGVSTLADVPSVSDETFQNVIMEGGYGTQQISSHVMINGLSEPGTLPLNLSFALLGQRYVIDSHVFSNVVFDRVGKGQVLRMMPNPLDAAFAVLNNNQAATLLAPELDSYDYAPDLAAVRVLADKHDASFWNGTLYNLWLGSLRELSPSAISASENADALSPTFRTEAWGRRLLNTTLASWAQLRHDTVLYAKQSYSGGNQCEFPDGYVDPYPEFYAKLLEYGVRGKETVTPLLGDDVLAQQVTTYFDNLIDVSTRLRDMAAHQRTGAPFTQEMLDFINEAVVVGRGCGTEFLGGGWYKKLFFESFSTPVEWWPTIADVHTQPTDEGGAPVGKVLHVGTGDARFMVVIADTCSGPRAYAGLASTYYEHITSNFERLDDPTWETMVRDQPDVPWFADLVVR